MNQTLRNKNQKGFTLIELLVVIAIIGLLASVVLLALNSARAKARDAKRLADLRQLASALELFFNDNNSYPTSTITVSGSAQPVGVTPNYIGQIPVAPAPADGSCDTTTNSYTYSPSGSSTASSYTYTFCIGAVTGGYGAGTHSLTPAGIQ